MDFRVKFHADNRYVWRRSERSLGLRYLAEARRVTNRQDLLPAEVMSDVRSGYAYSVTVKLTEEQARQAGHFDEYDNVGVRVPPLSLNRYVHLQPQVHEEDSEYAVPFEWSVDEQSLLWDWLAAGAPLEWDPGDEGTSEDSWDC